MAQSGFDERFEELYRVAYRVGYRLLGRHEPAQDAAQEALTRAFVHWKRVGRHPDPAAWVARVTANLAADAWRRHRTPWPGTAGAEAAETGQVVSLRIDLNRALRRLSRRQREVVVLRYLADLPEGAVARALGCSPGAVKQHASRALAAMRLAMQPTPTEVADDVRTAG